MVAAGSNRCCSDHGSHSVEDQTVKLYSIEELTKMYALAPKATKLWILLGMNFAWGAREMSTAKITSGRWTPQWARWSDEAAFAFDFRQNDE
jgi:hypothetical protein